MGNTSSSTNNENKKRGYGCIPEHYDHNDKKLYISKEDLKDIENTKEVNISKLFPPVRDQGVFNTSTAICISDIIIYEQNKTGRPKDVIKPCYMFIHFLGKGLGIRGTLKQVNQHGTIMENQYPINQFERVFNEKYNNLRFKNKLSFKRVPRNLDYFKACLVLFKRPIIFGYAIYESFFDVFKWCNDGVMPMPKTKEKRLGIQTGICVGYSEQKKCFLIRNSWGATWKSNGFFFMPFDYIVSKNCDYFWTVYLKGFAERTNTAKPHRAAKPPTKPPMKKRKKSNNKHIVGQQRRLIPSLPLLEHSYTDSSDSEVDTKKSKKKKKKIDEIKIEL